MSSTDQLITISPSDSSESVVTDPANHSQPTLVSVGQMASLPTSLSVFDGTNQQLGDYPIPQSQNDPTLSSLLPTALYASIGNGNQVVIATCLDEATALIGCHEISRVVAPLAPEKLIEVCEALLKSNQKAVYIILGIHDLSSDVAIAKQILSAESFYPPESCKTWRQLVARDGKDAVRKHITKLDQEREITAQFAVTEQHLDKISEARFVFPDLIIQQHIVVICAEPNAGKTTICNWICTQISERYKVRYLNLDCSGPDAAAYFEIARSFGFEFINFDLSQTNPADYFAQLDACEDLTNVVLILDTLKKFADLNRKGAVRDLMFRLRSYCNKGATIVLLAHTTKYRSKDGMPVFDGVGDIKNDCDELIYLIPENGSNGNKVVDTLPDKIRGEIKPISFLIEANRQVSMTGFSDPVAKNRLKIDAPIIAIVQQELASGEKVQKELLEACSKSGGFGKRKVTPVLEYHSTGSAPLWTRSQGPNNSWIYKLP